MHLFLIGHYKSRNLRERLRNHEENFLRFINHVAAEFINNQGERDIRMTNVQQNLSGWFRSMDGIQWMVLKRSAWSAAVVDLSKNGVDVGEELEYLFRAAGPEFIHSKMDPMTKGSEYLQII
jgi:transposase